MHISIYVVLFILLLCIFPFPNDKIYIFGLRATQKREIRHQYFQKYISFQIDHKNVMNWRIKTQEMEVQVYYTEVKIREFM